jgi:uncharacterized protein (DUF2062 family)
MTFPLRLAGGLANAGALRRRHPSWWAVREVAGMRRAALLCIAMVLSATVSVGVAQAAEVESAWPWFLGGALAISIGLAVWFTVFISVPAGAVFIAVGITKLVRMHGRGSTRLAVYD